MFAITHRKIFYTISIIMMALSVASLIIFGLKPSIDFTGGSMLEGYYESENAPTHDEVEALVFAQGYEKALVRKAGDNGFFIKLPSISNEEKVMLESALTINGVDFVEKQFTTVGPTLGRELATKSTFALLLVIFAIVCYVAYVFRAVSKPVSSWKYGFTAIIALVHDVVIALGFFSILGAVTGTEIDTLFVTALLVILGYSVNDSIVVLDRVRENLGAIPEKLRKQKFTEVVGASLRETIARSVNTSITTLLALIALFIFGGQTTHDFSLALIVGVVAGAYSSIFIAAPLLVTFFKKWPQKEEEKKEDGLVM
jgi:preprotein translocase subunit SecF